MARIEYFLSVLSPWVYFGGTRLEEIAAKHGAEIAYKPVDIMAVFKAQGGKPLAERPQCRQDYRLQELRRASAKYGLPYHESPAHFPTDAGPASRAILAVIGQGGDPSSLIRAFSNAVWAEQKNIAEESVVNEAMVASGHDPVALAVAIADATPQLVANTDEAIAKGVFGVPSYLVGDELFWGQDRLEDLDWHLGRIG